MVLKIKIKVMRVSRWHTINTKVCINRGVWAHAGLRNFHRLTVRVFQCHSTPTLQSHSDTSPAIISLLCECISAHTQRLGHKGHIASSIGADRKLLVWLLTCFLVSNVSFSDCQWDRSCLRFQAPQWLNYAIEIAVWKKKMQIQIIDVSI